MIILRNVLESDLNDLFNLSKKVFFINLPQDKQAIKEKIESSIKSFKNPSTDLAENHYIFVAEDTVTQKVVGVSMIHAQHGTENEPHFFLKVSQENKYSSTINTGFVHGTLKLGLDTNGPTEIGGLVLDPQYRGQGKIGKQLSFVRFLFMGLNPNRFREKVHSELMPPLDEKGNSPLWEAIGRRFLNMDYYEADLLSRNNKEFILSLFPSDNIYMTLLPIEARNAIGKVGQDTLPVKAMLEKIGFQYTNEVDPFDGGPHYRCNLKDIKPIKNMYQGPVKLTNDSSELSRFLLSWDHPEYSFFSMLVEGKISEKSFVVSNEYKSILKDVKKVSAIAI